MKINWGTGIAIFYSLFVSVMIFAVVLSSRNKSDLVLDNYYEKDLAYESFRQKRQNESRLEKSVNVEFSKHDSALSFSFPNEMKQASGSIFLFRPSNKSLDKSYEIKLDNSAQMVIRNTQNLMSGLWKIQVEWKVDNEVYYYEQPIVL